jgi:hypothetical protein
MLPHEPQLLRSQVVLMQAVPHWVKPVWHEQLPATHKSGLRQTLPQVPQLFRSVWRLRQTPPQTALPEVQ